MSGPGRSPLPPPRNRHRASSRTKKNFETSDNLGFPTQLGLVPVQALSHSTFLICANVNRGLVQDWRVTFPLSLPLKQLTRVSTPNEDLGSPPEAGD
jgi:hypothetical protein